MKCEAELDLSWTKDCVLMKHHDNRIGANFMITSTKFYVPRVTLSINDNTKFLEILKQGFKRTISRKSYISEITTQPKTAIWIM